MTPLRAAVIGTGRIAVQHLSCLSRMRGVEVVAVCDLSPGRAEATAARFRVPAWYTDHRRLLERHAPAVVHVTTPPASHLALALDALAAGAHVFVEKPAAPDVGGVERLLEAARGAGRCVVESYTYVFSEQVRRIQSLAAGGALGEVIHADVTLALGITEPGSPFLDPHLRHPTLDLPGGPMGDFTPHLASLAVAFAGPHRHVAVSSGRRNGAPLDGELRALIAGERATATVSFSADARPEGLWLQVTTTRGRAAASLFEARLTTERVRPLPRPVQSLVNGLLESRDVALGTLRSALRKVDGGPGSYEGLWTLIRRTYAALAAGAPPPVEPAQILAVSRLVAALADAEWRL